ncbi:MULTISPECIES: D-amino acid aminotransferase [Deefgea]|uniref:D-amino acid aminotransferase n=1 Tax=Deefgea chitinilytica TaxID=570276 RepID=A0ABS2C867_9NEIS|nr:MULTISPECIES: D-amino acid aminotransferase [Deefgea]MBM5570252.1 D-amino acid aminotransferase [Deefgea chitinilytica]MBM9887481.1 D-amino acid aminotransferase [Deefgea sp. CFH1-16]
MHVPQYLAYLNGEFAPLDQLKISVLDRGFLFGDGVYEMIPVYSRVVFRLDEHLSRLEQNLAAIGIPNPHSREAWRELVLSLVAQQTFDDQSIYLQVSRGPAFPRNHAFPAEVSPTVFIFADQLEAPATVLTEQGVSAVTATDVRWLRCNIKAISLLANVLAKQQAADAGVAETILLRDGLLIEGAASNIFIVKTGIIYAPAPSELMLTGITYDLLIELAGQYGLPLQLGDVTEAMLRQADEVWLTSSSKEILAIVLLDGQPVGNGQVGPIYKKMLGFYQEFKRTVMRRRID